MAGERNLAVVVTANLNQLRAEMAKAEAIIGTTSSAMRSASKAYDGTNTIAQANAAMLAVEKIGGVSKLTESEQRRMNATLQEGLAKYAALGKSAPDSMVALERATRNADPPTSALTTRVVALGTAAGNFIGRLAYDAFRQLGAQVGEFIDTGMKLAPVQASFQRLASGVKANASEMLDGMKVGSRGLVSEYDLMTAANKAMLLGLPVSSESMADLAGAATTLGRAMGQSATKSVDDLITALGRSSPMILDNLGITVKVSEANEAYASKMNIVGRELTDTEKKMAFYEEAMRKARDMTSQLGDQTETLGEIGGRVWTSIGNHVSQSVSAINIGLGSALSSLSNFVEFSKTAATEGVAAAIVKTAAAEHARTAIVALTDAQKKEVDQLLKNGIPAAEIYDTSLGRNRASVMAYIASLKPAADAAEELTEEQKKAAAAAAKAAEAFQAQVDVLTGKNLIGQVADLARQVEVAGEQGGVTAFQTKRLGDELAKLREQGASLPPVLHAIWLEHERLNPTFKVTELNAKSLKAMLDANGQSFALAPKPISSMAAAFRDLISSDPYAILGRLPGVLVPLAEAPKKVGAAWAEFFDTSLPAAINSAIQGGGSILEAAGSAFGSFFVGEKGFGGALTRGMKSLFGDKLGTMISGLLPGLGSLVGPAISNVFGKLFGSAGRDAVKEFAASMGGFDQLRQKLIPLGDEGERLWKNLTQGVGKNNPQQAQAAIDAITSALERNAAAAEAAGEAYAAAQEGIGSALAGVTAEIGRNGELMLQHNEALIAAQAEYERLVEAGAGQDDIAAAAMRLNDAQLRVQYAARTSQEEFDRLARIAMNTFTTLVASGESPVEAMRKIGTSVDDLIKQTDAFGLSGNAAYDYLARWRNLTEYNAPLLDQVSGLNDLVTMTATLGGLSEQAFADMAAQGRAAYDQMISSGFKENEALVAMKPLLQTLNDLQRDKGYAIDESTEALLRQARESGIIGEEQMSTNAILMEGLGAIIQALGYDLPESWRKLGDEASRAGREFKSSFEKDATSAIDGVKTAIDGLESQFVGGIKIPVWFDGNADLGAVTPPAINMAQGGMGTVNRPTMFRVAEVPGSTEQFAFSGANKTFAPGSVGGGAATEDSKLQRELAAMRDDMSSLIKDQPRAIGLAVRDALLHSMSGGRR